MTLFAIVLVAMIAVVTPAEDWPQFRGQNRDGISPETGLLDAWPKGGPKEVWRKSSGEGYSAISIVRDRLYTTEFGNGPRATPTVDGETVRFHGDLMREHYTTPEGNEVYRTLSYDALREQYRVTEISSSNSFMDILEGTLDETGRLSFFDVTKDSFKMEYEVTIDGGENWWVAVKAIYDRGTEMAGGETE